MQAVREQRIGMGLWIHAKILPFKVSASHRKARRTEAWHDIKRKPRAWRGIL